MGCCGPARFVVIEDCRVKEPERGTNIWKLQQTITGQCRSEGVGFSRSWFMLVVEPDCWGLETLSYKQLELVRRASECAPRGPAIATWDVWTRSDLTIALLLPANEIMPIHLRCWRPERDGSQGDGYLGFGNIRLEGFASVARVRSYQSWVGRTYLVCWNGSYSRACGYLLGGCWRL